MPEATKPAPKTASLTIGDTTYKTAGNILFSSEEGQNYYLAESTVLDKMDHAIQKGILENGMQTLMKKIRS
jgi:hypothetical protein